MPDGILDKIVNGIVRALTGIIVGSGGYQLFDGHWFGQRIFGAYLQSRGLGILTEPSSTEVYGLFAAQSVPGALQEVGPFMIAAFFFVGLVVLAHVISKPNIEKLSTTITKPQVTRAVPRTVADIRALRRYSQYIYVAYQPFVSLLVFVTLAVVFFGWPFQSGLALAFLLAVLPPALHLLLYPKDLTNGGFQDRFVYMATLGLLVVTLYGWPQLYGAGLFEPDFPIVSVSPTEGNCDDRQMQRGPRFVAFEKHNDAEKRDERTLLRLCFSLTDGKRYVDFFGDASDKTKKGGRLSLSQAVNTFVLPEGIAGRNAFEVPAGSSGGTEGPIVFVTPPSASPASLRVPGKVLVGFVAAMASGPAAVDVTYTLDNDSGIAFKLPNGPTANQVTAQFTVEPAPGAVIERELEIVRADGPEPATATMRIEIRRAGSSAPADRQLATLALGFQR